MSGVLSHLTDAPLPNLLLLAGLGFLAVGIVGKIEGKINLNKSGRTMSGLAGVILMIVGFNLHVSADSGPASTETVQPAPPARPTPAIRFTPTPSNFRPHPTNPIVKTGHRR
jgi:hypothetical protein